MQTFLDADGLELWVDNNRFLVQHDNHIAFLYAYRGYTNKPYIAVLRGPSGRNVLEDSPGDHVHHHGVWWGHGDVNGVDFYLEVPAPGRRLGRIQHCDFEHVTNAPPRFGFTESLDWRDDEGERVIEESRSVLVAFGDPNHYTVDLDSTYTAKRDLAFGTTKESVLPGIRMAEALTGVCGGHIRSSFGGKGERQIFGQPAEWFDYWGDRKAIYGLGDVVEGVAVFDHPSNPNHPNPVFVRSYGPNSPFQGHHFTGETTLASGESWRYRHRLVVHYGDTEEADIAGKYASWIREDA
jgi:methane monooxygenase PmoA-like